MNTADTTVIFAGGCFWCTETIFSHLKGIKSVMPGYVGGTLPNPTYEQVCAGGTGHLESVKIVFDPTKISFEDLLSVFFNTHDPTTTNRQGNDVGEFYNSAIFYADESQKNIAENLIKMLNETHAYEKQVVTKVRPISPFYGAEDYHRNFYENHRGSPYCDLVIAPKLETLQKKFKDLLQQSM